MGRFDLPSFLLGVMTGAMAAVVIRALLTLWR
jgi:hypothetical protein